VLVAARDHVVYHAAEREDRFEPVALLDGYDGYVIADASAIYHDLYRRNEGIVEVGCWSHARRKFFDALSSDKQGATHGLVLIGRLYGVNRQTRKQEGDWQTDVRAQQARPILDELYAWVAEAQASLDAKSPLRLALNYLHNHREPLARFLSDGRIRLDNNLSELALRRQVIGRKNWLFLRQR
jgi:transposase